MAHIEIWTQCPQCHGRGQQYSGGGSTSIGPFDCVWPGCTDGYVLHAYLDCDPSLDDIMDKVNDIKEKVDEIKAKVDEL